MLPLLLISCICCRPAPAPQPTNEDQTSSTSKEPKKLPKTDFSILKQPKMQLTCLSFFIIYFGMFSPFFFTTSYGVKMGFSDDLSFYTVSIVNGASFFGRILPGIVADKYGKFNSCIVATSFAGIIALCWTKATSVAGLVVWSAAYGFASGVSPFLLEPFGSILTRLGYLVSATSLRSPGCYISDSRAGYRSCYGLYFFIVCFLHPSSLVCY